MQANEAVKEFYQVYTKISANIDNDVQMQFFYERGDVLSITKEHEDFNKQMRQELNKITSKSFEKHTKDLNLSTTQSEYYLNGLVKNYNTKLEELSNTFEIKSLEEKQISTPSTEIIQEQSGIKEALSKLMNRIR